MSTTPVRIDDADIAEARSDAEVHGRSTAAQIAHWARIGRELERAPSTSVRDIAQVLSGHHEYDALNGHDQAVVRARWRESIADRLASVDVTDDLEARGSAYAVADEDGHVTVAEPDAGADGAADAPSDEAVARLRDVVVLLRSEARDSA